MTILTSYKNARRFRISSILRATDAGGPVAERNFECNLRSRQTFRKIVWVLSLATLIVVLSGCGGGGGGSVAPSGDPPPGDPPPDDPPPAGRGGVVPGNEQVVAFPETGNTQSAEYRVRRQEMERVLAMHRRGGTGKGEIVGIFDSGTNERHPDLGGQFHLACAMGNCAHDNRPELNRADGSPLEDTDGHGTPVSGVVAAKKNGQGVFGIAYEAKIASYGNTASIEYPWGNFCDGSNCPPGLNEKDHQWGREFDKQTARGMDWMRSLGVGVTSMSWGRSFPWPGFPEFTKDFFSNDMMPLSLPAFKKYVEAGGVVVWAAGNGQAFNPAMESMLPRYFSELEKGWVSVVGLDGDGGFAGGSYRCGVAADWCIAAPIVLLTTSRNGKWDVAGGTSFAAPYVAGGLAALKSMFPNLSYHQLRDRIFRTADKTGQYSNRSRFGQGRLNLDAASSPVGGTNFALGTSATGPVSSTAGTRLTLPRPAIEQNLNGQFTLVFDGYQRAPFKVGLGSFAEPRSSYLSMDDLALTRWQQHRHEKHDGHTSITASDGDFEGFGLRESRSFVGFGRGAGVTQGLARLVGAALPNNDYRMSKDATGVALGFDNGFGIWHASLAYGAAKPGTPGFGVSSWHPKTVVTTSFVPKRSGETTRAQAFGITFASGLKRPMGWQGTGALELKGDSVELGWRRNIATHKSVRVDLTNRVTRLALQGGPLLQFDDALLGSTGIAISFLPNSSVTLETHLGVERPIAPFTGSIRTATSVDESGRIDYQNVAIDGRKLLSFNKAVVRVGIKGGSNSYYSVGIAAVRDGFGSTASLAGFQMESKF